MTRKLVTSLWPLKPGDEKRAAEKAILPLHPIYVCISTEPEIISAQIYRAENYIYAYLPGNKLYLRISIRPKIISAYLYLAKITIRLAESAISPRRHFAN